MSSLVEALTLAQIKELLIEALLLGLSMEALP